jgi:hypothetical protein
MGVMLSSTIWIGGLIILDLLIVDLYLGSCFEHHLEFTPF